MSRRLFVGNLPFSMTEDGLKDLFEVAGQVVSVRIIVDRETQRPKGFGFVEFENVEAASAAIAQFCGRSIAGRALVVTEARPREAVGPAQR